MKIVILHPHGNENTSRTVSILDKSKLLHTFWTTIAFPKKINFLNKKVYNINYKKVKLRFLKELLRQICSFLRLERFYISDNSPFSVSSVYNDLDLKVSKYLIKNKIKKEVNAIYSYEDCALNSFEIAKKNNIKTIYDLTSPYWRLKKKIIDDELKIYPNWSLSSVEIMSEKKCLNKDKELLLTDKIIVASTFSAKSLELFKDKEFKNLKIIPYGVDCPKNMLINKRKVNDKFKILFVGRPVLSKGIHYLIQILSKLEFPWEVEIAGTIPEKPHKISKQMDDFFKDDRCKFLGQITNEEVKNKMKTNHVFLFPSLFEGFGQVILESMSCSLPTITTYNTAGNDLIKNGTNGYLTKIRDINDTKKILHNLYDNEELRLTIAENSYKDSQNYSWKNYEKNLQNFLIN